MTKPNFLMQNQRLGTCLFLALVLLIDRAYPFSSRSAFLHPIASSFLSSTQIRPNSPRSYVTKHKLVPGAPVVIIIANEDDDGEGNPLSDNIEEEEEEDEEETPEDPYTQIASSEFIDGPDETSEKKQESSLVNAFKGSQSLSTQPTTSLDWGGALGKLRQRLDDIESGKSQNPSHVLFRLLSQQSPNQVIGNFIQSADPQVIQAMSGAVSSLLGGLSSPMSGVEMIVKASGEKIGSLCFQLQMTGYMFRNAEYVMALKQLMKIRGTATMADYKQAFNDLDSDGSGYIEASEIEELLDTVYDGDTPGFEVKAFLKFFDIDQDGKISWNEFERGLGTAFAQQNAQKKRLKYLLRGADRSYDDDEDDDAAVPELEPQISGTIEVELEDGNVVQVEANEYINDLKKEVKALKMALRRETLGIDEEKVQEQAKKNGLPDFLAKNPSDTEQDEFGGIANYIASRRGDLKALTEGISPEIVETMKMLVDFVLEDSTKAATRGNLAKKNGVQKEEIELELPGSALQQLALWQLVLGYRLREAEAKGDYLKLLD